ncbi:MAG: hypothetical protein JSS50_02555 [Proteobacteria bacterium]|nr:hypothetical protein [Pseudomonadota bacterium]
MTQMPLPFEHQPEYLSPDFIIASSNAVAYQGIMDYESWPEKRMILLGDKGCGKTHLTHIWAEVSGAQMVPHSVHWPVPSELAQSKAWFIDDISLWTHRSKTLFHYINYANEYSIPLLLTAQEMPHFSIPDLRSRLDSMHKLWIYKPDQSLLKAVILKQLSDRSLQIKPEVLDYLGNHIERNFSKVYSLVDAIDHMAMREKKGVTLPLIKKILQN